MKRSASDAATKQRATSRFEIKAVDAGGRTFSGLASTWDEDSGGDVIEPGAFTKTLNDWRGSKERIIPLIDQHSYGSVLRVIGKTVAADETMNGLEATFKVVDGADGDAILNRLDGGFINALSIGFEAKQWTTEKPDGAVFEWDFIRHLTEIKLWEVSLVIWPMNENALVDASSVTKAVAEFKARGAELTPLDLRALHTARSAVDGILADYEAKQGIAAEDARRLAMDARLRKLVIQSVTA